LALALLATPVMLRAIPVLRDLGATALTLSLDIRPHQRFYWFAVALCLACALFAGLPAGFQAAPGKLRAAPRSPPRYRPATFAVGTRRPADRPLHVLARRRGTAHHHF